MVKSPLSDKMLSSICVGLGIFLEKYKFYNSEILIQAFNSIIDQYKTRILLDRKQKFKLNKNYSNDKLDLILILKAANVNFEVEKQIGVYLVDIYV